MQNLKIFIFLIVLAIQPICLEARVVNKVVAVVNEEIITQQDVDQMLSILYAQYANEYKASELLEKMEETKRDILKQIIEDKLILSRAKELGIKVIESEIDDKLKSIKDSFPSEKDFYQTLQTQGITVANLRDRYRDQIMMKKIVNLEIKSKIGVLPSEAGEYYQAHRGEFVREEKYRVRHILIKAKDDVDIELAKVEAEDVYSKLTEGYDFAELVKRYSEGPNKEQDGDMGYIGQGEMLDELDEVIFTLAPGEFSRPVKTQLGYHIVKVVDIKNSGFLSLEEVQNDIKKVLFQMKIKERLNEWLEELRREAYILIK